MSRKIQTVSIMQWKKQGSSHESHFLSILNQWKTITYLIRTIFCTIRGSNLQVWTTSFKHVMAFARSLKLSSNKLAQWRISCHMDQQSSHHDYREHSMVFTTLALSRPSTNSPMLPASQTKLKSAGSTRIKQNDDCLSEELQSSCLPSPRYRPVAWAAADWKCALDGGEKLTWWLSSTSLSISYLHRDWAIAEAPWDHFKVLPRKWRYVLAIVSGEILSILENFLDLLCSAALRARGLLSWYAVQCHIIIVLLLLSWGLFFSESE